MRRRRLVLAIATTVALAPGLAPRAARADERHVAAEAEARRLYDEALRLYDVGRYDRAIEAFKDAYLLSPAPELLFDIAQSYRREGPAHCVEALEYYRKYRDAERDPVKRRRADPRIAEIESCAAATPAPAPAPVPPGQTVGEAPGPAGATAIGTATGAPPAAASSASAPASTSARAPGSDAAPLDAKAHGHAGAWPFVLGGTGIVAAGAGTTLWLVARGEYASLEGRCGTSCSPSDVDGPRTRQTIGVTSMIVGGALLAGALVLGWVTAR